MLELIFIEFPVVFFSFQRPSLEVLTRFFIGCLLLFCVQGFILVKGICSPGLGLFGFLLALCRVVTVHDFVDYL